MARRPDSTYVQEFSRPSGGPDGGQGPLPPLPRQRRRRMLVLGLLLVVAGALTAGYLFTGLRDRTPVLMVSRDVPIGTQLTAADLATTQVATDTGVAVIPSRQLHQVIGRFASVDLRKGTLLAPSQLTSAVSPRAGQQVVPVSLKLDQLPARGLNPGDLVLVVATPGQESQDQPAKGTASPAPGEDTPAIVDQVSAPDADGVVRVDLLVDARVGPTLAMQASTGRLALVLTARGTQ